METYNHDRSVKAMEKQRLGEDPSYDETKETWEGAEELPPVEEKVEEEEEVCPECEGPLVAGDCQDESCPASPDYSEEEEEDEDEE
jgi:hypothetical protein